MSLFAVQGQTLSVFIYFVKIFVTMACWILLYDHYENNECIGTLPCPILYHIHTHNIWVHNRLMVIVRQ